MAKRAKKEELERFRRDLARLRSEFTNTEIAQRIGIDPANLSSYGSGAKNPGLKIINQFYMTFDDEMQNQHDNEPNPGNENTNQSGQTNQGGQKTKPDYPKDDPTPEVEETRSLYKNLIERLNETSDLKSDYIHSLKEDKERLWKNLDEVLLQNRESTAANKSLADSQKEFAKSQREMAKSNLILAENNRTLVNKVETRRVPYKPSSQE